MISDQPTRTVRGLVLVAAPPARMTFPTATIWPAKASIRSCIAQAVIAQILPEPQASLLTSILLGNDSGLPKSIQGAFRATGTSHVIAISG